jgi:predicted nucleic acid-binding protein
MASILIYVDTNVYLDFLLNRTDGLRPLGDNARVLFERTVSCEFIIVVSDLVLSEAEHQHLRPALEPLLTRLASFGKLRLVETSCADQREARMLPTHYADALHAVLARKSGAAFVVTMNIKDFEALRGYINVALPYGV